MLLTSVRRTKSKNVPKYPHLIHLATKTTAGADGRSSSTISPACCHYADSKTTRRVFVLPSTSITCIYLPSPSSSSPKPRPRIIPRHKLPATSREHNNHCTARRRPRSWTSKSAAWSTRHGIGFRPYRKARDTSSPSAASPALVRLARPQQVQPTPDLLTRKDHTSSQSRRPAERTMARRISSPHTARNDRDHSPHGRLPPHASPTLSHA